MPQIRAFQAIRPRPDLVSKVASLPYDVMNREEAKEYAKGNKYSFLHITRSEIDLPDDVSDYDEKVYEKAKENLDSFINSGFLFQETNPCLYIYTITMKLPYKEKLPSKEVIEQSGIVCLVNVEDYENNRIKKHELTRQAKLKDRIRHFTACDACTESVFLAHKSSERITELKSMWMRAHQPEYSFQCDDGITHKLWKIEDESMIHNRMEAYGSLDAFYIADGHHRSASAAEVCKKAKSDLNNGYFLATIFSCDELNIMDYNRVIADLNGYSAKRILELICEKFEVREHHSRYHPKRKKTFGMYLEGRWYELILKREYDPEFLCFNSCKNDVQMSFKTDEILNHLDVSILQDYILSPIFKIEEITKDERIDFVGGIRGLDELEKRVSEDMKIAFSMFPTSIQEVFEIADHNLIMPPKSTWFEPKLRSGLFLYRFDYRT